MNKRLCGPEIDDCLYLDNNNQTLCNTCDDTFMLTIDKLTCGAIIPNCKALDNTDPTKCGICNTDYFFDDQTQTACISDTTDCVDPYMGNGPTTGINASCV